MSFFGVELNAQINKLNLQIRLNLSKNKHTPNIRTIFRAFFLHDKAMSGLVTLPQFEEALNKNGLFFKKFEIQAYDKAYGDGQGKINWFQFLSNVREQLSPERRQLVERVFDHLDTEHKGAVRATALAQKFDPSQFQEYKEGKKTRDVLERELMSLVNLTPEGMVTKQEFLAFYDDLNINIPGDTAFQSFVCSQWGCPVEKIPKSEVQEVVAAVKKIRFKLIQKTQGTHDEFLLKKVFDEFDLGKEGSLGSEDLFAMLVKLEIPIQRRLLEPVFRKFDRNSNGRIEYNEFKNFLFFDPLPI